MHRVPVLRRGKTMTGSYVKKLAGLKDNRSCMRSVEKYLCSIRMIRPVIRPRPQAALPSPMYFVLHHQANSGMCNYNCTPRSVFC